MDRQNKITPDQQAELVSKLKTRFAKNTSRHQQIEWADVESRLHSKPEKVWSLFQMEQTGGEPDVIGYDAQAKEFLFIDCSSESPKGRRSLCYDRAALESRKEYKPENSAMDLANLMGIELCTEEQYRNLQLLGEFDLKTSSWIQTPHEIRKRGGALFCDRRYNTVFVYHNGSESYYAARGFRGFLMV